MRFTFISDNAVLLEAIIPFLTKVKCLIRYPETTEQREISKVALKRVFNITL